MMQDLLDLIVPTLILTLFEATSKDVVEDGRFFHMQNLWQSQVLHGKYKNKETTRSLICIIKIFRVQLKQSLNIYICYSSVIYAFEACLRIEGSFQLGRVRRSLLERSCSVTCPHLQFLALACHVCRRLLFMAGHLGAKARAGCAERHHP